MQVDGKKSKREAGSTKAPVAVGGLPVEWYNPQPSNTDVEWLDGMRDLFATHVADLVTGLYVNQRITLKLDVKSGRWIAILFDDPSTPDGIVHALSCRASSAINAVVLLHYFHMVKFKDGWKQDSLQSTGDFG